ncbi:elongation factor P [Myxococcota bacterium]|nr:elongation factor P [Myxococcota bacterium]MBU1429347.1 elongation factor P [Myxococcota bacterium]MBU1899595.1 elongation factor P [Myxococcota bacterium]
MYQTNEFRKGLKIIYDDGLWEIVDCQHVKPGKGVAFVKTRMKNLISGQTIHTNFRSGDKVGRPDVSEVTMQALYQDGDGWCFMDNKTYEQLTVAAAELGDRAQFLKENIEVGVVLYNGRPIGIELPNFVELKITECEPGVRGDTAQGATKPATLESGAVVNVPLFVEEGEVIRVDTRNGEYSSRVK